MYTHSNSKAKNRSVYKFSSAGNNRLEMSEFLARKVQTYFEHFDLDKDGYVSLKDCFEFAEKLCDSTKADAAEREQLKACYVKVWRQFMKSSGSDDNGLLTASIFAESVKQQRNDPEFKETYLQFCHHFFRLRDVNGDGFLQEDEYTKSLAAIGVTDVCIGRNVFQAMDQNGDAKLSLDEFCNALLEYLTSEDENSPFACLWGPLVD